MRAAILIINLIIAYVLLSGWPDSLPVWMRAGLALIVVMVAVPLSDASSKNRKRPRLSSLRAPKWLDYLYIGAVIFCIELLLLAVFTLGPKTTEEIHGEMKYWLTSKKRPGETTVGAPEKLSHNGAGNWLWDNHFRRSHPKQASKRPPNKPEIFMNVASETSRASLRKHSIYLRSFALDHFDGDTWSIHQPTKLIVENLEGSNIQISPVNGTWRSRLPLYSHTITQPYYSNGQNLLTTLQNTIDTDVQSLTKVSTDTYVLPRFIKDEISYSYSATSQPILLDQIVELDKNIAVGESPHSVYVSKVNNSSLQRKLTKFAASVDKSLPLALQLSALKKLINDQCSYSLDIENKREINALENFLFEEKSGYCEFYASAAAMLCRELGIPSRIAFGWSGGKFFESSELYVFRSKDAHAWTEIYLDGYGWVIYDTTPPSANAVTESESGEDPPDLTGNEEYLDEEYLDEEMEEGFLTWMRVLIVLAVFIFLVIILLLVRRFTQPSQSSSSAVYVKHEPKYLQLFQKVSSKLGYPIKPGQTLMQSVQYLKNQHIDVAGLDVLLDNILSYHYDTVYRYAPADKVTESNITSELKKIYRQAES
jgi:transglutaminase-like putative cysteine protease